MTRSLVPRAAKGGNLSEEIYIDDVPVGVLGTLWVVAASFLPNYMGKIRRERDFLRPLSSSTDPDQPCTAAKPPELTISLLTSYSRLSCAFYSPNSRHQSLEAQNQLTGERMLLAADTHHGRQRRPSYLEVVPAYENFSAVPRLLTAPRVTRLALEICIGDRCRLTPVFFPSD